MFHTFTTNQSALSPASSSDTNTTNLVFNSKNLGYPVPSGSLLASAQHFPERSDQPECRYYMKTGSCKYGSTCKYHHPRERNVPLATGALSPLGLPLRPVNSILNTFLFLATLSTFHLSCCVKKKTLKVHQGGCCYTNLANYTRI